MTNYFSNSSIFHDSHDTPKKNNLRRDDSKKIQIIETGVLNLFSYDNNKVKTNISISGMKHNYKKRLDFRDEQGTTYQHYVQFSLCGINLDNSYSALNSVLSVIKVFEKHKFGAGSKSITVKMTDVMLDNLYAMCRIVNSAQGNELLEIGICQKIDNRDRTRMQTMHVGYVYAFQNALVKAMNWICPLQGAEHIKD